MSNETLETPPPDQGSRAMPDFVKRGLIRVQGGLLYLKAPYRVLWMREEHPDWAVVTSIVYADWEKGFAVVQATIMDGDGRIMATAHSEESRGKLPYLRKAETGAIARALALCGYGTQFGEIGMEDEEMILANPIAEANARQPSQSHRQPANAPAINTGPETCAECRAPKGKPHASGCKA